jgi:hypothetical protein
MKKWRQLTIILSILLVSIVLIGWRLTSTTARKHGYVGMQLEINDLTDVGVVVHGPDSEGFNNKLSSLLTIPGDLVGDATKYSLIIENKTPQHINAISVIWRFYPSQGKPIEHKYEYSFMSNSFFDDVSDSLIKSGELYPLCAFVNSAGFGRERLREIKSDPQMTDTLSAIKSLLARSTRWSFTIDSVLFSNGVWVGPNKNGYVELLSARINGARDMLKELAQKLDAGEPIDNVLAHAQSYAGPQDEPPANRMMDRQKLTDPNYQYEWAKKNAARQVLARQKMLSGDQKNFSGDQKNISRDQIMIEWIRGHTRKQIPLVKR